MKIDFYPAKEESNRRKHGLDFSFAEYMFDDPLAVIVYDRFENGEHRWHLFSVVGGILLLAVHTYPDPGDQEWVRIIGLRRAEPSERRRYEEGEFD